MSCEKQSKSCLEEKIAFRGTLGRFQAAAGSNCRKTILSAESSDLGTRAEAAGLLSVAPVGLKHRSFPEEHSIVAGPARNAGSHSSQFLSAHGEATDRDCRDFGPASFPGDHSNVDWVRKIR